MRATETPDPFRCVGTANEQEEIMRMTSLIVALVAAGALAVLGQEGTVESINRQKGSPTKHTERTKKRVCIFRVFPRV